MNYRRIRRTVSVVLTDERKKAVNGERSALRIRG
jgi:hypothetical protein